MFEGVFCPSITITDDDGKIDYELWGRHLDHLADAGINGVLLFGSIGEFYSVSLEDKKSVIDFAVERVAGRMKVFVGVGDTTYDNVLELTRYAQKAGARRGSGGLAVLLRAHRRRCRKVLWWNRRRHRPARRAI